MLIKPLVVGNKTFPINLIQGPLAGISCAPFRLLAWQHSQPAFTYTEMISCKTLIHQSRGAHQRFVFKDPAEGPVCFQLAGNDPTELATAAKIVTDYGADLIDLNCGCPVKKIRKKGAGSRLLTDPSTLYQIIRTLKQNTSVPVLIKIRVQGNSDEKFNGTIAQVIHDAGADAVVVHGRHWTENYATPCRFDDIQFFVEQLKIPVIGNGDIADADSLKKMLATGCSGAMISRAGVGQPWLIAKLAAEMQQKEFTPPSAKQIGRMLIEHVESLTKLLNSEKFSILQARKFAKYYARHLPYKLTFMEEINRCETLHDFNLSCQRYFEQPLPLTD